MYRENEKNRCTDRRSVCMCECLEVERKHHKTTEKQWFNHSKALCSSLVCFIQWVCVWRCQCAVSCCVSSFSVIAWCYFRLSVFHCRFVNLIWVSLKQKRKIKRRNDAIIKRRKDMRGTHKSACVVLVILISYNTIFFSALNTVAKHTKKNVWNVYYWRPDGRFLS